LAKVALLHTDVSAVTEGNPAGDFRWSRMLPAQDAQDAQEQPFAGGRRSDVKKKAPRRLFSN